MVRDLRRHHDEAVRITTAASSRRDDIAARQRRYVFSMSIRTACFVAAILLRHHPWAWGFLVAAAIVLPYVAVVMANAVTSKSDSFALLDAGVDRRELPPHDEPEDRHDSKETSSRVGEPPSP